MTIKSETGGKKAKPTGGAETKKYKYEGKERADKDVSANIVVSKGNVSDSSSKGSSPTQYSSIILMPPISILYYRVLKFCAIQKH